MDWDHPSNLCSHALICPYTNQSEQLHYKQSGCVKPIKTMIFELIKLCQLGPYLHANGAISIQGGNFSVKSGLSFVSGECTFGFQRKPSFTGLHYSLEESFFSFRTPDLGILLKLDWWQRTLADNCYKPYNLRKLISSLFLLKDIFKHEEMWCITVPWGRYCYYSYFSDEETEEEKD